jgi:dipeptidyl-peptidase-4
MRLVSIEINLRVRHLETGLEYTLVEKNPDRDVFNRSAVWSPDGKRIAYIQSDYSKVRKRAMLIPDDPSYPTLREVRFARVGEVIPSLRVGVVSVVENGNRRNQMASDTNS